MNSTAQTLFNLYRKDRLAPFYIIRPPVLSTGELMDQALKLSYKELCLSILQHNQYPNPEQTLELGHSDITFIDKEEKHKNYKQDDPGMLDFFSAQKHGPLSLKRKLIWVDQAHHITEKFLNKWLKTLEEPQEDITTFFLVPHQSPLLQTIESRAITLKIGQEFSYVRPKEPGSFAQFLQEKLSLDENNSETIKALQKALNSFFTNPKFIHEAIEQLKNKPELQSSLFENFQEYWCTASADPRRLERALEEIKWMKRSQTFHNLASERLYGLLSCLSDQV